MFLGVTAIVTAMYTLAITSTSYHLAIGGIFFGIGFGLIQPGMLALCINYVPPSRRGAANATYWTAFDIGVALGSILWGMVTEIVGYEAMFKLGIIPPLLAMLYYFIWRKTQKTQLR